MRTVTLGTTGIKTPQNAFGALPIQRVSMDVAEKILRRAYEGGMTFFDTARSYSDSEEKIAYALGDVRKKIFIATKTMATDTEELKRQLDTSLNNLKTDYVDIYQFHNAGRCYRPGDGSGMYECVAEYKRQGVIRHIGLTAHKIGVAEECVTSGLYETLQFPFSYISGERELALVQSCKENNVGFIAMKGLAGGLLNNSKAAYAYLSQFENVLPIWGIQKEEQLDEWLFFMKHAVEMDDEIKEVIEKDRKELGGEFCRSCGYCMPCPQGIIINQCARISLMLRRAPSDAWLTDFWQQAMKDTQKCTECGLCKSKCPYGLDTPRLLKENYEDYKKVLAGEVSVR